MSYDDVIKQLSEKTGLSQDVVIKTYEAFWFAVRENIKSLPIRGLDESKIKHKSFNIPELGKLYCDLEKTRKKINLWKDIKQE